MAPYYWKICLTLIITVMFVWVLRAYYSTNRGPGVIFESISFEQAIQKAEEQNKLIFLDAYAGWCAPCKKMTEETFSNSKVAALFNSRFINIKKDVDGPEGELLASRYNVTQLPSLLFIDRSGKLQKMGIGFYNPNKLIKLAKRIIKNSGISTK